jgi:riboflavin kinase/FMN adenylyltransferase
MIIERNWHNISAENYNSVIALGSFDGIHLGHQKLIGEAVRLAKQLNTKPAVLTFSPHPAKILAPNKTHCLILPEEKKYQLLASMGIEMVLAIKFDAVFTQMSAQDFIEKILLNALKVKHIITGYNFHFGYAKQGNTLLLQECSDQGKFGYTQIPQVIIDDHHVSSSLIKEYLGYGAIGVVCKLLGRDYTLTGVVQQGLGKAGNTLGFPTANIWLENGYAYPARGVYLATVKHQGKEYVGIINLGKRPTFKKSARRLLLEVHLFDFNQDIYNHKLEINLKAFIRPEVHFSDIKSLREQIARDCVAARYILNNARILLK